MKESLRRIRYTLLAAALLLAGCHNSDKPVAKETDSGSPSASMTVTVEKAQVETFEGRLLLSGTVEPWQRLTVSSEVGGLRITSIPYQIGQYVDAGQGLIFLNKETLQAQLAAAQARYSSSRASLEKARLPNRSPEIGAQQARVQQAEASLAQEEANLSQTRISQANAARAASRYETALQEGYVTALETDERVTNRETQEAEIRAAQQRVKSSQANLKQAREELRLLQSQGRPEDIAIAQAQSEEALASVRELEAKLNQTKILAPDSGLILQQKAYIGDVVTVGQELIILARQGRLQLWARVPQEEIGKIQTGQTVQFDAAENGATGTVAEIDPDINPETRQGRVRIELGGRPNVKVGAFLEGEISLPEVSSLTIPYEAVSGSTKEPVVFVLEGESARQTPVKLGQRRGEFVEVTQGLQEGQSVIVSGATFLHDGDTVKVAQ